MYTYMYTVHSLLILQFLIPLTDNNAQGPIIPDSFFDDDSDISSVPLLPSPMRLLDNSEHQAADVSPQKSTKSLGSLSMEMELQDLLDRVTAIEANYDLILLKQDEIISRLVALENRPMWQQMSTTHDALFQDLDETSDMESFSFNQPPVYIPPPPRHPPQRLSFDEHAVAQDCTPSRELQAQYRVPFHAQPSHPPQPHGQTKPRAEPCSQFNHPPNPPRRFILTDNIESGLDRAQTLARVPFHPITNQTGITTAARRAIPVRAKSSNTCLPSSAIDKQKLITSTEVIMKCPKLRSLSRIGTLTLKLVREAFFGEEVLSKCTVAGERDLPGLPIEELQQLEKTLLAQFPKYWKSPQEFEPLWKTSTDSVGQLC